MVSSEPTARPRRLNLRAWLRQLGPGLITGAADDDPSGIATYSQVGAQFGLTMNWVMLFSLPLMVVIQMVSARIGMVTGCGIAENLRAHYPRWLLNGVVIALLVANIANLGADLGAMGEAVHLLIGGPVLLYTVLIGFLCVAAQIYFRYARYAAVLKWLTLSLLAYVGAVLALDVPWREVGTQLLLPRLQIDGAHLTAIVALLGTTISPYLFFWQASQEVEEQGRRNVPPLAESGRRAPRELQRVRIDTWSGMVLSNSIGLFVIIAAAQTLHQTGVTDIRSAAQAAEALRPIAGEFAFAIFALGIIGTGLLAVPVLAGSAAYAVCEATECPAGLDFRVHEARMFYGTIALSALAGLGLNALHIDPMKALYWSAVLNGFVAAPVMAAMMLIATNRRIMKEFTLSRLMRGVGWLATAVMAVAGVASIVT